MNFRFLGLFLLLLASSHLIAQKRVTVSGYVRDKNTGEDLLGASIFNSANPADGVSTNVYGFYSLALVPGEYEIEASYVGYYNEKIKINLTKDSTINFLLSDNIVLDSTIVVTDTRTDENVESTDMGKIELPLETAKKLPALLGEVDILKTFQLMPGVISASEGSAGFYVRGGGIDQNLILLDDAVVYNPGHLFGFFSVFNSDAIKNATMIKGGMPANYGGRLSSVMDVQMKEGNNERFGVEGGIGIVSSRLTVEGPLWKKKISFMVSGRRTYVFDLAQPFLKKTAFAGTNYYFYDLNIKANYRISQKDQLFASGYFGRDVLKLNNPDRDFVFNMPWGNATATLRWTHLFDDRLFMNATFIYNDYDFSVSGGQDQFQFKLQSGVTDAGFKVNLDYYPTPKHQFKFGGDYMFHIFTPNRAEAFNGETPFIINPNKKYAHEAGIYALDDWKISRKISLNIGVRASLFQQVGPYTSSIDSTEYGVLKPVKTYFGLEPRLSSKFSVSKFSSIKVGVTMGRQYIHLVSNSTSTLPTDLWVPSTEVVKPQWGMQYAVGYFHNFLNNMLETSIEGYYKDLYNQLDYSESFTQTVDTDVEQQFISGRGRSYGMELFLRKTRGPWTGWISYTLSRAERTFEGVKGKNYLAGFDRPHNLNVVFNWDINKRWNVGAVFVLGSGRPFTPVKSIYLIGFTPVLEYGLRNSARIPIYHRLDLSVSLQLTKPDKPFQSTLVLSVYNVYNRRNVFATYVDTETDALSGSVSLKAYKVSLFPIIPSITWNFAWKQPAKKK